MLAHERGPEREKENIVNLQQVMRVVVCAALVAVCVAGAGWFPAQPVAGQETRPITLHGAAVLRGIGNSQPAARFGKTAPLAEATRFRAGLRNAPGNERLNAGHLNQVLQSLRERTGWQALDFDEEGFLVCPQPNVFSGGSGAARRLLGEALFGAKAYDLEAHNRSQAVSFARLAPGTNYESSRTGVKISGYLVQIDFADFYELRGDGPALKAFDIGLVILHELAHGVWQLRDAARAEEEPGECETFINRIRRELQLPERRNYRAHVRLGRLNVKGGTLIAELHFVSAVEKQGQAKQKRFLLQWEVETVGAITIFDRAAKAGMTAAFR